MKLAIYLSCITLLFSCSSIKTRELYRPINDSLFKRNNSDNNFVFQMKAYWAIPSTWVLVKFDDKENRLLTLTQEIFKGIKVYRTDTLYRDSSSSNFKSPVVSQFLNQVGAFSYSTLPSAAPMSGEGLAKPSAASFSWLFRLPASSRFPCRPDFGRLRFLHP